MDKCQVKQTNKQTNKQLSHMYLHKD